MLSARAVLAMQAVLLLRASVRGAEVSARVDGLLVLAVRCATRTGSRLHARRASTSTSLVGTCKRSGLSVCEREDVSARVLLQRLARLRASLSPNAHSDSMSVGDGVDVGVGQYLDETTGRACALLCLMSASEAKAQSTLDSTVEALRRVGAERMSIAAELYAEFFAIPLHALRDVSAALVCNGCRT